MIMSCCSKGSWRMIVGCGCEVSWAVSVGFSWASASFACCGSLIGDLAD